MKSVLEGYEHKTQNQFDLDMAVHHICSIANRISDIEYQKSLGLIIGLVAEESISGVIGLSLESVLFKFRYFYDIDQDGDQWLDLEGLDQIES